MVSFSCRSPDGSPSALRLIAAFQASTTLYGSPPTVSKILHSRSIRISRTRQDSREQGCVGFDHGSLTEVISRLNNMNGDFNASVWQQLAATSSSTPSTPTPNVTLASLASNASQSQRAGGNSPITAVTSGVGTENMDATATTTTAASTRTNSISGNVRSAATSVCDMSLDTSQC